MKDIRITIFTLHDNIDIDDAGKINEFLKDKDITHYEIFEKLDKIIFFYKAE